MKKIIISILLIISICMVGGANVTASDTASGTANTKPVVKKPVVKKVIKKQIKAKNTKKTLTQTGVTLGGSAVTNAGTPLGKEKGPLAVVLYKYIKADVSAEQIAYIDTSIREIKAGLAYYEQDRDPNITPEKIKINMKAFLSSAVNEMNDRDIFVSGSLDALKTALNGLIDGLGK